MIINDLTGRMFGKLKIVERHPENYNRETQWICRCECGNPKILKIRYGNLTKGYTKSCGCFQKEATKKANTIHDLATTPEYNIWKGIKNRCRNGEAPNYKNYGGRGITMCDEWYHDFLTFYRDMGSRPSPELSVERRENDKGYSKENCYWATRTEQNNNTRRNVFHEYNGHYKTLSAWCRELNLNFNKMQWSVRKGMTFIESMKLL